MSTDARPDPSPTVTEAAPTVARHPHRTRNVLITLGVVVALLLGLVYVGAGWYFAGRVESGGLTPTPSTGVPTYDLTATTVTGTAVTLNAPGDVPIAFDQNSQYALMWDGGSAHVGAATIPEGATTATRPLADVTGTPLAAGTAVALERDWYLGNPKTSLGLDFTEVSITGPLGPLPAWYVPGDSTTWAIMVHGKGGLRREFLRTIPLVHAAGLPALVVTYRNDLGNAPDPSGQYGFGATEWPDLQAAVDYATAHGAQRVVFYANSMGAGITAAYLQHSDHVPPVAAMVLDAPMLDFADSVALGASQLSLPGGLSVPSSLIWAAERIVTLKDGVDWGAIDYADNTAWVTVPVLVVHGVEDPVNPIDTSRRFAANVPGHVTLVEFPGAAHMESWNTDRPRYEDLVTAFLQQHTA